MTSYAPDDFDQMPASHKLERVNFTIQKELGSLISSRLSDPRLPEMLSVTRVEVSPDLSSARVYVSILTPDSERSMALDALQAASGFLGHELERRIRIRRVPKIRFFLDSQIADGEEMSELIDRVLEEDRKNRTRRHSAGIDS